MPGFNPEKHKISSIERPEVFNHVREKILATVEQDRSGIEIERVGDFFKELGLTPKKFVIYRPEQKQKLIEATQELPDNLRNELAAGLQFDGAYVSMLGLVFVERREQMEQLFSAQHTEFVLVHELAHSSAEYENVTCVQDASSEKIVYMHPQRLGFESLTHVTKGTAHDSGSFQEEGFAEYLKMNYREKHGLYKDTGFTAMDETAKRVGLPLKYIQNSPKAQTYPRAAFAAAGLELLIAKDPSLFDTMLKARKSVSGLRDYAKKINAISPGLYMKLRNLQYESSDEDFVKGYEEIKALLS